MLGPSSSKTPHQSFVEVHFYGAACFSKNIVLTILVSIWTHPKVPKSFSNPVKMLPRASPILLNPHEIDLRWHQQLPWWLCWTPHWIKLDFLHKKDRSEAPRSPQETPNWSEIWDKFRFCSRLFFDAIFQPILQWFFKAQNLKNVALV